MTSSRKIEANRRNAKANTGPRSDAGKARSANNARRHGLAVPISSDVQLSAEAEHLANLIAGEGATPELLARARQIADAQIELRRVRQARYQAFDSGPVDSDRAELLRRMDRYERRALSLRNGAIHSVNRKRN
jgi:hypothetical protein